MENLTDAAGSVKLASGILWLVTIALMLLVGYYLIQIGNRYVSRNHRLTINFELIKKFIFAAVIILIGAYFIRKYPIIRLVLSSTLIAAIVAFILNPLVDWVQKHNIKRSFSVLIVYVSIILIITILLIVVIPGIFEEVRNLAIALPQYTDNWASLTDEYFHGIAQSIEDITGINIIESANNSIENIIEYITEYITRGLARFTTILTDFVSNVVQILARIVLIFVMAFYFLVEKDTYIRTLKSFIPESIETDIYYLGVQINRILEEFIRGRALMAVFVGIFTTVLLLILRIDFAIVIGIITGIADIIPYIGPAIGFIPAVFFALIQSPIKALIIGVFFFIIQWAENNILGPKILGESMDMDPLFILVSIIVGGGMFGIWGMIVSVPLFAIIIVLIRFAIHKYRERRSELSRDDS